jgi:hypothetical protein
LHHEHGKAQQQIAPLAVPADRQRLVVAVYVAHALTITRIRTPVVGCGE